MTNGIYDYARLADNFATFVDNISLTKKGTLNQDDRETLRDFSIAFRTNPCYKLNEIRNKAIRRGQDMISIPVDMGVQAELKKAKITEAVVSTHVQPEARDKEPALSPIAARRAMKQPVARQSTDDGEAVKLSGAAIEFDALGNII